MDIDKNYEPNKIEKEIYSLWEESGYFAPETRQSLADGRKTAKKQVSDKSKRKPFCIIMPPPNANGSLHLGHAVGITIEDIMTRYHRMKGDETLWLPGADHAGFETQVVFEKKLEKEGTSRFEILKEEGGREKLYGMIKEFTQANKAHMENQIRQLGASCDWSREKFTLDDDIIKTVYETFKKLYDDGLVYRDKRIVNWCVKHQTSLSDLEVSWEEKNDKLYYVKYEIIGGGEIVVATTRPETIPGDVAIAVNPKDNKYKSFIGKTAKNPLTGADLKIIADEAVDMNFGTGALKITPAHDAADFEIGKRHNLEIVPTIGEVGVILPNKGIPPEMVGLKVLAAREKAVELLGQSLFKTEEYKHQVGVCYKCKNTIEPLVLEQWFIDLTREGKKKIVQPAIDAVKKGKIRIIPKFQEKIFFHWMENIKDWNISRQIVWGIRIPAWQCSDCGKWMIETEKKKPAKCVFCGGKKMIQSPDVFDTWFSSGQWPFATLLAQRENPKSEIRNQKLKLTTKDYQTFYPTSVMETGYDILFFWVARMIMLGLYRTGKIPFKNVYLHGLVRDKDRQKMSKSKGNVIDPLGVAETYGTDALRMALVVGNTPGQDVVISEDKIRGYRNFATKIWNIGRFILMNNKPEYAGIKPKFSAEDKKYLDDFKKIKTKATKHLDDFEFYLAAEALYHYVWHTFADEIIEASKPRLQGASVLEAAAAYKMLEEIFLESLKMLHPFMPFVTEAMHRNFRPDELLIIKKW
ncbi:valine--tRNA ligase [Patescibacteria group bacterium]|nr:valine--tRNA ligase [Patescibacteria group bacterium]MCL5733710.1 valine--tRNA ligase [Patescibacteria group bacterium]